MATMSLAYLGLAVTDQEAWLKFAVDGLGLVHCGETGGSHRLRLDERSWRIALHQASGNDPDNDILYAGFDLDSVGSMEALRIRFQEDAIVHQDLTTDECRARGVSMGITTKDPEGLALEFVFGRENADRPFQPPHQRSFVTGEGGLGHIVLSVKDLEGSLILYRSIGFSVSDYINIVAGPSMTIRIAFLHCNKRHHTVALAPMPGPRRLDHIMLETATVDGVISTYYRLLQQGYTMKRHLGRHPNDGMLSFYVMTPAGFDLELGSEGVEIDREWEVKTYDRISVWGHDPVVAPVGASEP